jgi:transposase
MEIINKEFLRLILPKVIVKYFELQKHEIRINLEEEELHLYYDETNSPPTYETAEKIYSKGFYPISKVQDFPIRGKAVYLHIRRRKWWLPTKKKTITRDWDLVAKGTRMTESFAAFLKEEY